MRQSLTIITLLLGANLAHAEAPLIVHEWGTITSRHAPDGTAQGRMNRVEHAEALPAFVHYFEPPQAGAQAFASFAKGGATPGRTDVTLRLETPVVYFYGTSGPFDVRVHMRGGVLNQFYPTARATLASSAQPFTLDERAKGALEWRGIVLDDAAQVPATNAVVWTAPRKVTARRLMTGGEGEHYLFYRGVAHVDAPLATSHGGKGVQLSAPREFPWLTGEHETIARVWLIDVRGDEVRVATRGPLLLDRRAPDAVLAKLDLAGTRPGGMAALRASMKSELVAAGLYDDEAEAMLNTWDASYFRTPGLRVFYFVPRSWIDYYLPLEVSVPNEMTRVLIGRIDLS